MTDSGLHTSNINSLPLTYRGKVRDIYSIDDDHWLIITTDRVSAFDVVFADAIPGKGKLLTELAVFWFRQMDSVIDNHLVDIPLSDILPDPVEFAQAEGRSMVVKRLQALPIEAVVRGYLTGSGWKDYQAQGNICGIELPAGLQQAERLPELLFTPATKAALGNHDENISFDVMAETIGLHVAEQIRSVSLKIYQSAAAYAEPRGLLIADTKFEFGLDDDGSLTLMDEILTPDSSRFWESSTWRRGISPPSYDKQFLRDYLESLNWDKTDPGPSLPQSVIDETLTRYREAVTRITQ